MSVRQRLSGLAQRLVARATKVGLRSVLEDLEIQRRLDAAFADHWQRKRDRIASPIVNDGAKFFSQNDEDGILMHLLDRMSKPSGVFVELGVGDGLENNTLLLLT